MLFAITKIFYTIQGEGFHAGAPAIFIRLAGCNLQCPWCDTDFKKRGNHTSIGICERITQLLNRIRDRSSVIFVITGGEPTLQKYIQLVEALRIYFPANTITMETNGRACADGAMQRTRHVNGLWVTASPKLAIENCSVYFDDPKWCGDELKIVLDPKADWSVLITLPDKLHNQFEHFYIQPCFENDNKQDAAITEAIRFVKENPTWRLSLQTQRLTGIE